MSYQSYYPNGWQSGGNGKTPITPEALNHMDKGIRESLHATESPNYSGCYYRAVNGAVEWINPPMLAGVEYLTTERFGGNPVYVKRISFGNLPASGSSNVSTGISNATCVSITPTFFTPSKQPEPYPIMGASGPKCLCWLSASCATLYVQAISDVSTFTGEFIIKYTKK